MKEQALPPPVSKLDADALVRTLNTVAGTQIELIGPAPGGEVGAAFVRWPDGRDGVLTRGGANVAALERTAEILRLARARRVPCPRYDLVRELPAGTAIVQERMPGMPPRQVDDRLIHSMLANIDRFAGVLADRPDVPVLGLYLDRSGPGFCLHESLERYDGRARRLLRWVREVGEHPSSAMRGSDLVHADFHPGNVLINETGDVTRIVDWDGASRGDRRFGLVTLAFDLGWGVKFSSRYAQATPDALAGVNARLDAMDQDLLRAYWAHMSLRLVDWSIRHHSAEVVDHYLDFASSRFEFGA